MDDFSITNCYMAYIDNEPYLYPSRDEHTILSGNNTKRSIPTGWQIIPNILWRHFCKPKQWYEMVINYEAYCIKGIKVTLFNPIPITNNLAIQRTSLFAAFNNCTYCNTYEDTLYETSWHPWYERTGSGADTLNLLYKEGVYYTGKLASDSSGTNTYSTQLYKFPQYIWKRQFVVNEFDEMWSQGKTGSAGVFDTYNPQARDQQPIPAGLVWDPYERPEHIGELRAGKNACTFSWTPHDCDQNKIFMLDRIVDYSTWTPAGPYIGSDRFGTGKRYSDMDPEVIGTYGRWARTQNTLGSVDGAPGNTAQQQWQDYSCPNWSFIPICPNAWFWQEIKSSIADRNMSKAWQKIDKYWAGTETEQFKYPPHQMFVKGIPLYDSTASPIKTLTQVSVKVQLNLGVKKRRSAYYCPTWGPFSGEQLYYHNPHKQIFQDSYIRYKTGGLRRTWQNINRIDTTTDKQIHLREDCYALAKNSGEITSDWYNTSSFPVAKDFGLSGISERQNKSIIVTYDKASDKSTVHFKPSVPSRKQKIPSPEKYADVQMLEEISKM